MSARTFADLLARQRDSCGLTQEELADKATEVGGERVSRYTILRWESGHAQDAQLPKVRAVCKVLQLDPGVVATHLLEYEEEAVESPAQLLAWINGRTTALESEMKALREEAGRLLPKVIAAEAQRSATATPRVAETMEEKVARVLREAEELGVQIPNIQVASQAESDPGDQAPPTAEDRRSGRPRK